MRPRASAVARRRDDEPDARQPGDSVGHALCRVWSSTGAEDRASACRPRMRPAEADDERTGAAIPRTGTRPGRMARGSARDAAGSPSRAEDTLADPPLRGRAESGSQGMVRRRNTADQWVGAPIRAQSGLAERVGFEPTDLSINGFQDRRIRPLCHLSVKHSTVGRNAGGPDTRSSSDRPQVSGPWTTQMLASWYVPRSASRSISIGLVANGR